MKPQLADITAVIGGTGTGKTHWMLQEYRRRRPPRLLAWDPEGDFTHLGTVTRELGQLLPLTQGDRWSVVYEPPFDDAQARRAFDVYCRVAFARANEGRAPFMLIDELATVVRSGWAPAYWRACVSRGRKRGIVILAASQRPAEIDKTFWSQATTIRCTALNAEHDQRAMAAALVRPLADVQSLQGFEALERHRNAPAGRRRTTSP